MAEIRGDHPVSGEIIAGNRTSDGDRRSSGAPDPQDILDAEYETLAPEPERPRAKDAFTQLVARTDPSGLDILRHRNAGALRRTFPRIPVFWTVVALLTAGVFWVSGGYAIFATVAPRPHTTFPLRVVDVKSRLEGAGERAVLVIEGAAINDDRHEQPLPGLSIDILDDEGKATHYFLGTREGPLAAGERFAFSSRLAAPKKGVTSVSVTFRPMEQKR